MVNGQGMLWGDWSEEITLENPTTHGAVRPRLTGGLSQVVLMNGESRVKWSGQTSDSGVVQAWGAPILEWNNDATLQEMDAQLRGLVDQNFNVFRVRSQDLKLDTNRIRYVGANLYRYVTYQRMHTVEGVRYPVEDAFLTFRFKFGRLYQMTNYTFGQIGPVEWPAISMEDAVQIVMENSQFQEGRDEIEKGASQQLQPFYTRDKKIRFRFIYRISVRKAFPEGKWNYSVAAADGRIARLENGFHTVSGSVTGEVFSRLPTDALQTVPLADIAIKGGGFSGRDGSYEAKGNSATAELRSHHVKAYSATKKVPSMRSDADGNIHFTAEQNISETMAFFHINRLAEFVRGFIQTGTAQKPGFLEQPISVFTSIKTEKCNAWYDPQRKTLNFLAESAPEDKDQCVNSGHISDIVYHEWGHALDDALGGIQDGAFSEGIGDITAVIMTGDPRLAPGFEKGSEAPIRNLTIFRKYPDHQHPDPHVESLIVSGAWYEALLAMQKVYGQEKGRAKTAELFFKHLVSTENYLDSYMGALLVDDDNGSLDDCTPNMCILNPIFVKHGIAKPDDRCGSGSMTLFGKACAESTVIPN